MTILGLVVILRSVCDEESVFQQVGNEEKKIEIRPPKEVESADGSLKGVEF